MNKWRFKPARDLDLSAGARLSSVRREPGLVESVVHRLWCVGVLAYLKWAHRLRIHGHENIPSNPPFILACNHCSHLDVLALTAALPRPLWECSFPIAAGDTFFETPGTRAFSAFMLNALPMWRRNCGAHALRELRARLADEPCVYILFPEGTRSRDGIMGRFHSGLGMIVAETNVPVVPCHLRGTFDALPPHRVTPRLRPIALTMGPLLRFSQIENNREGWECIAQETRNAIEAAADK